MQYLPHLCYLSQSVSNLLPEFFITLPKYVIFLQPFSACCYSTVFLPDYFLLPENVYSFLRNASHKFPPQIKVQNNHINPIFFTDSNALQPVPPFNTRIHSLNNPGYQGVNLKTSLADINSKSKFISGFPSCPILHFILSIFSFLFATFQADFAFMASSLWAFWSVFFSICPYYLLLCIALVMHAWSQTISSIN